jgi:hypothetical protein
LNQEKSGNPGLKDHQRKENLDEPHFVLSTFDAGLPDGLLSNQKSQFGEYFGGPWYVKY